MTQVITSFIVIKVPIYKQTRTGRCKIVRRLGVKTFFPLSQWLLKFFVYHVQWNKIKCMFRRSGLYELCAGFSENKHRTHQIWFVPFLTVRIMEWLKTERHYLNKCTVPCPICMSWVRTYPHLLEIKLCFLVSPTGDPLQYSNIILFSELQLCKAPDMLRQILKLNSYIILALHHSREGVST